MTTPVTTLCRLVGAFALLPALALLPLGRAEAAMLHTTDMASVSTTGAAGDQGSWCTSNAISGDGRYVVFKSAASNLDPAHPNPSGFAQIYVRDRVAGTTRMVSVTSDGTGSFGTSDDWPSISRNGRHVVFSSNAGDLLPGITGGSLNVFRYDLRSGRLTCVSPGAGGIPANGDSHYPSISDDGHTIAFFSNATNLVSAAGSGFFGNQAYVHDVSRRTTMLVSADAAGTPAADGSQWVIISGDGHTVAFVARAQLTATPTAGQWSTYVRNLRTGTVRLVSMDSAGTPANGPSAPTSFSANGRFVLFSSQASNLVPDDTNGVTDIFLRDLQAGTTTRVNLGVGGVQGNSTAEHGVLSADGRVMAFSSHATNVVPDSPFSWYKIYVRDLVTGDIKLVSARPGGAPALESAQLPSLSADASVVSFSSFDPGLAAATSTQVSPQVYVRTLKAPRCRIPWFNGLGSWWSRWCVPHANG